MKIYSLLLVKNEADIIASILKAAAQWSDKVIVMDNGSTDETWEIVQQLATEYPQIIPFAKDDQAFQIGLRAVMFDAFKSELTASDWWCIRLDADEFFVENPRDFLATIPKRYKQVCKASIDYCLTHEDVEEYTFTGDFEQDKHKIRYYQPYTWAELRFLRHSKKLQWETGERRPEPCGLTYPQQIKVLHYQFRSPQQMQQRYAVRQQAKANGCGSFRHEKGNDWNDYLRNRNELVYDKQDGTYQTLGNRNKFNKWHTRITKGFLTLFGYY